MLMIDLEYKKSKCRLYKFIGIIITIIIIFSAFDVRLKTIKYEVESDKIQETVRIALLTDLHSCKYGSEQKTLISAIEKQNPDIVLLGGDICDDKISDENTEFLLKVIGHKYPCYYVTGNHEYWSGRVGEILELFQSYNVTVLRGNVDVIEVKGQRFNIGGIDDPEEFKNKAELFYKQLESIEEGKSDDYFSILLAHRPIYIESYLEYDFDLVLSGHEHGGQWRIPGILNGVYAPDEGWFPKYAGGSYTFDNGELIVSRGLARESTRVPRIFNRPELVIIDVK